MKRRILIAAAAAALPLAAACTPQEVQRWQAWHAADPVAAEAFADDVAEARAAEAAQAAEAAPAAKASSAEPARGVWDRLAECESGGNWSINTGNGYYGGLQFSLSSWRAVGGSGYPHEHSRAEQINRAERLLDLQGWGAWPTCSRKIGLR